MYLKTENGSIANLALLDRIEFRERDKTATGYVQGVPIVSDSQILYRYFTVGPGAEQILAPPPDLPK